MVEKSQTVVIGWDLYERTGSAFALGWMGLLQFLPVILLFLPAGQIADRFDRRWVIALLPIYAKDILRVGPAGLGWLTAAVSIGALAASVTQGIRRPFRRQGMAFAWLVAGFGVAIIVFGLSTSFWLSLFALVAVGALDNISVVTRKLVVQYYTPDELRGRVSAVNRVFISSSNELGAFESGALAALTGPVFTAVFGGLVTVAFVVAGLRYFPALTRMGSLVR